MAFVLDAFSRRIVGWQLADHLRTDLPLDVTPLPAETQIQTQMVIVIMI